MQQNEREFAKEMIQYCKERIQFYRRFIAQLKKHRSKWEAQGKKELCVLVDENITLAEEAILAEKREIQRFIKKVR